MPFAHEGGRARTRRPRRPRTRSAARRKRASAPRPSRPRSSSSRRRIPRPTPSRRSRRARGPKERKAPTRAPQRVQRRARSGKDFTGGAPAARAASTRRATTTAASGAVARAPTSASSASAGSACASSRTRATSPDSPSRAGRRAMSMTDPIADFLTRIRNGLEADLRIRGHPGLEVQDRARADPARAGLHRGLRDRSPPAVGETLRVRLKYTEDRAPVITGLKRVSRPGRREYVARGPRPEGASAAWAPRSSPPRRAS